MATYLDLENPHQLLFLPASYPGESFYSVLCRYHVMSGNASGQFTRIQLFGYDGCVGTTLLSPFRVNLVDKWVDPLTGINSEKILYENTAFPLYASFGMSYVVSQLFNFITGRPYRYVPAPYYMQKAMLHKSGHLRYCPHCVRQQIQLYGEPYWQILPQIINVEYCPIHGTRILDSSVSVGKIKKEFIPASAKLTNESYSGSAPTDMPQDLPVKYRESYIRYAQNVEWLQNHCRSSSGWSLQFKRGFINAFLEGGSFYCSNIFNHLKPIFPRASLDLLKANFSEIDSLGMWAYDAQVASFMLFVLGETGNSISHVCRSMGLV